MMLSRRAGASARRALATLAAARPSLTVTAASATGSEGKARGGSGGGLAAVAALSAAAAAAAAALPGHAPLNDGAGDQDLRLAAASRLATSPNGVVPSLLEGASPVASCESQSQHAAVELFEVDEAERFRRCLAYHRSLLTGYKSRWAYSSDNKGTPTTSWPTNIPSDDDVGPLTSDLRYCRRSPNYRNDEDYCDALRFRIGSYWLHHPDLESQKRGLKIVRDLAERGHPDGMCLYGMVMNDGRAGLDPNPQQAVVWYRLCSDMHSHDQATYELAVALYTGEGVPEDEAAAARLFRRSADTGHPGAAYMLGDCLLDGVGVVRDRAEALEWLVTAAELGHRGARSRVLAVLSMKEGEEYGKFTDSSRQTLIETVKDGSSVAAAVKGTAARGTATASGDGAAAAPGPPPTETSKKKLCSSSALEQQSAEQRDIAEGRFKNIDRQATFERRYTIGGGARNPVVLARRKTIIQESRDA